MTVPVRWVLDQPELKLTLKSGAAGVSREINLALTTELADPAQWLSGGELVLTTGIGLPKSSRDRRRYLRSLDENNVAALGFGTGLTFDEVPPELVSTADELGMPLLEIPLRTPFAAVVKAVSTRIAELEYDAVLRASRRIPGSPERLSTVVCRRSPPNSDDRCEPVSWCLIPGARWSPAIRAISMSRR